MDTRQYHHKVKSPMLNHRKSGPYIYSHLADRLVRRTSGYGLFGLCLCMCVLLMRRTEDGLGCYPPGHFKTGSLTVLVLTKWFGLTDK